MCESLPVRDDALRYLTHQHEEQDEGKDPAHVVPGEVQPSAVMDVHLRALAAPACKEDTQLSSTQLTSAQ